jgi:dGTPase
MDKRGKDIIEALFSYFKKEPDKLPESTKKLYSAKGICVLGDYIAGMTDRYAINQYDQMISLLK